jgi:hypothetical protein
MDAHYPTVSEPATPEYVLAVVRDMHRQQARFDPEADADAVLTFDTTVAEWRQACDLLGWRALARGLNAVWGTGATEDEWRAVLEPGDERRLADVCAFLARRAARPRVRAARLLGRTCAAAGAFLTVRSLLREAGADPWGVTPSAPLAPYTRRYTSVFLDPLSRLAPGALPPVRVSTPVYDGATLAFLIGLPVLIAGACFGSAALAAAGGAVTVAAYSLTWLAARFLLPSSVEFGDLRTFRDLAVALSVDADDSR